MTSWIIILAASILSIIWVVMFFRQLTSGLTATALDDKFTWGLYVQGFFYFSALAGGILIFIALVSLFEISTLRPLAETAAVVSFACLVSAALLLGSDLGKPFRGARILTGKNFASPLTWDFYMLSICGILNLVFLLGLIPGKGFLNMVWSVLCLIAALGYVMIHTLFFLSRVEAGFRSQPFFGMDTLAQSLWGGMALVNLIALASGYKTPGLTTLLIVLTVLALIPLAGAKIASLGSTNKGFSQIKIIALDVAVLIILLLIRLFSPGNPIYLSIVSVLILTAVFLEKSHLIRQYQRKPTLPLPYSRYEEVPDYSPTLGEWALTAGSVGVCTLLISLMLYLKMP